MIATECLKVKFTVHRNAGLVQLVPELNRRLDRLIEYVRNQPELENRVFFSRDDQSFFCTPDDYKDFAVWILTRGFQIEPGEAPWL